MFVSKGEFAKLLQDNESRIYWRSGAAPDRAIVHQWHALDDGRLLLREIDMPHESIYWAAKELMKD